MEGRSNFKPLFVNDEGQRYNFYIWDCPERKRIKQLIQARFGRVTKQPEGDYTIQLADPTTYRPGEIYSIHYITKCCSEGKLLDLRYYRINPISKYTAAFSPVDVLQGHIRWKDADVFSLEYENSQKEDTHSNAVLNKRRKVSSSSTSNDDEVEMIEQRDVRLTYENSQKEDTHSNSVFYKRRKVPSCTTSKDDEVEIIEQRDVRLTYENSQKEDTHSNSVLYKRNKVPSCTTSKDDEVEMIEQRDVRQSREDIYNQCKLNRDIEPVRRKRRSPYKLEEKEAIVQYIKEHKAYRAVKGTAIWKNMEEDKVCDANRTWQSLKEHFLKHILPHAEAFSFSASEVALLNKISSSTRRKGDGHHNSVLQDSDDDIALLFGNRYTPEEDEAILKFMSNYRRYLRAGGVKIWQEMERKKIVPDRSWQSLKERYRKHLAHRLKTYVKENELNKIKYWKESSRSTKGCTCCAKSRSPTSTAASADTSHTSLSSELSTSDSVHHKRKLFVHCKSLSQLTPVSESHHKPATPAKQSASNKNDIQSSPGNTVASYRNCKGNPIRKVVSRDVELTAKRKVDKNMCLENKEKMTSTARTQNNNQQVDSSPLSSSTETSIVVNCGTPGEKNISTVSETLSVSEGQKCISNMSSDGGLGTSLTDANKESVPENENSSEHSNSERLSRETRIINPPSTRAQEIHKSDSENDFHESDTCVKQTTDISAEDKQLDSSVVIIANSTLKICPSNTQTEGSDTQCSPEKKEPVSPSDNTLDKLPDGLESEPSSGETHLHDEQRRKPQDTSYLEPDTDTARVDDVITASTSLESSKHHHKNNIFMSEHRPPAPENALLAKNIQFLYAESTGTTSTSSDSIKIQKKAVCKKSKKHRDSTVASKMKRIASKADNNAKAPEKHNKLKTLTKNLENCKGKNHLISLETSSVRNLNNRVSGKSLKNPFLSTSLGSFISKYKKMSHKRNMIRRNAKGRKGTFSGQHIASDGKQAIPSCSKNNDTNYSTESNQKTTASVQEKEITLSNNQGISFTETNNKQESSFKTKVKLWHMNVTEDMDGIADNTNSDGLHMEFNETQAPPSSVKKANTSIQKKEAILSNTQDISFRMNKHTQNNSFKDENKSSQICRKKINVKSRKHREDRLIGNKNVSKITASNEDISILEMDEIIPKGTILEIEENLPKETILEMEEMIPKETNFESTKSTEEILSEHREIHTNPNETISSIDVDKNESGSNPGEVTINVSSVSQEIPSQNSQCTETDYINSPNDTSCQDVHLPNKEDASQKITNSAVQECEISNSSVNMIHTQETNTSFNSESSPSELISLPVHQYHSSLNASSMFLIPENAPSSVLNEFPRQTENPESVLCDESDDPEQTNRSQESLLEFTSSVLETPEDTIAITTSQK